MKYTPTQIIVVADNARNFAYYAFAFLENGIVKLYAESIRGRFALVLIVVEKFHEKQICNLL